MKKLISVLLALGILLSLCACGKKDAAEASSAAGTYKATSAISDGQETIAMFTMLGVKVYLTLNEDGTGSIDMAGQKQDFKWDDKNLTTEDGTVLPYTCEGGKVIFEMEGSKMTFERLSSEELEDYQKNGSGSMEDAANNMGNLLGLDMEEEPALTAQILGAELTQSYDGEPAICVWYELTNTTKEIIVPSSKLSNSVEQGGETMTMALISMDEAAPESANVNLGIAPGHTLRCAETYNINPDGGTVTFKLATFFDDITSAEFDPKALPGAPADTFVIQPESGTPDYLAELPESLEDAEILDWEVQDDGKGGSLLLVRVRFTNKSQMETGFRSTFSAYAMQDGIGLASADFEINSAEVDNAMRSVPVGESIECACAFHLRTDSPVAFVLNKYFATPAASCAKMIELNR